jgi:5'-3' exoribonuclease 1
MGVPKFFRWMSERYPGISQLIAENRIPEFDCLYVGTRVAIDAHR